MVIDQRCLYFRDGPVVHPMAMDDVGDFEPGHVDIADPPQLLLCSSSTRSRM
jgi:hypothetical protein